MVFFDKDVKLKFKIKERTSVYFFKQPSFTKKFICHHEDQKLYVGTDVECFIEASSEYYVLELSAAQRDYLDLTHHSYVRQSGSYAKSKPITFLKQD